MSQALSIGKELFEIQCSDFTSEEKTSADQTPDRHPICMVSPAQQRGQCFYSVSDFKKVSEFFRSHKTLLLCPFMEFYRYGNSADTFIDFRLALRFVWTVCTLFLLKGNMKLLGFITGISTGFWLISCRVLWSSIFVTLMANKIGGLQFGIYRNCQISSRVFHTAVATLPLTKANRSDFE